VLEKWLESGNSLEQDREITRLIFEEKIIHVLFAFILRPEKYECRVDVWLVCSLFILLVS